MKALIFEQTSMLKSFASIIGREFLSFRLPSDNPEQFEPIETQLLLPSTRLLNHYIHWSGVETARYQAQVPPHLFFHLVMPLCIEQLKQTRYSLSRIVNLGCTMICHHPIDYQANIKALLSIKRLREVPERARISQHIAIFTQNNQLALELEVHTLLPLGRGLSRRSKNLAESDRPFESLGTWQAYGHDGGDFALLTGDFNPIHWSDIAGKRSPFGCKVLHGFGTFIRSYELLQSTLNASISYIDVRFTAPLHLPGGANTLSHAPAATNRQTAIPLKLQDHQNNLLMTGCYQQGLRN